MTRPLDGAVYKVARSDEQLRQLRAEMTPAPNNAYYRGMAEPNLQRREYILDAVMSDMALLRWGVITGEIVHNLRSALDLSMCALIRASRSESDCRGLYFPIRDEPPPSGKHLGELKDVALPGAASVVEAHQPYRTSDPSSHPLRVLHELNRWDKHRVLQVGFLEFVVPDGAEATEFQLTPIKDGATAYHLVVRYPPEMNMNIAPVPVIVFSEPGPAYADPVLRRLSLIHREVKAVTTELEPLFPSTP